MKIQERQKTKKIFVIKMEKIKLTKEEKVKLLKKYLLIDEYVKAIVETLNEKQLDDYINENLDTLLLNGN